MDRLLDELIDREGGYVNHPADRGGPTRYGITEAVARAHGYRGAIRALPVDEAKAIYRRIYWLRPGFDRVAERAPDIAAELFDTGVNMGPAVAATFLQRALTALNRGGSDYPVSSPTAGSARRRLPRWTGSWRCAAWTRVSKCCSARWRPSKVSATCGWRRSDRPMRRSFTVG